MTRLERIRQVIGSRALTVWLSGIFILYYLSFAVWSREAFARLINDLTGTVVIQALYLLLVVNIFLRVVRKVKRLWSRKAVLVLRLPVYVGLVLLLLSFFLSMNVRKHSLLVVGEGDVISAPWDGSPLQVVKIRSSLRKSEIKTADSLIFSSEPMITLLDEGGAEHTVGAYPPRQVGRNLMHVLNFGLGPGVELREKGAVVEQSEVALRLVPFGTVDTFSLAPAPYTFSLSILPNSIIRRGRETARQYDLQKPLYRVQITKGDKMIAQGETDNTIAFDKTMSLTFHPPADWIQLEVVHDPALPLFLAGLFLTVVGLILYPVSLLLRKPE